MSCPARAHHGVLRIPDVQTDPRRKGSAPATLGEPDGRQTRSTGGFAAIGGQDVAGHEGSYGPGPTALGRPSPLLTAHRYRGEACSRVRPQRCFQWFEAYPAQRTDSWVKSG